jgi:small Trp-rich protein
MWLIVVGVIAVALKLAAIGPLAVWPWWVVLAPFGFAVLWWQFADRSGFTQRAAMRRDEERAQKRRKAQIESLSQHPQSGARNSRLPADDHLPANKRRDG